MRIDLPTVMSRIKTIHFVGIGGSGMSGIAEVVSNLGFAVTGSDLQASSITDSLKNAGVRVDIGEHEATNVVGADVVVVSSAVDEENPEVQQARELRLPIVPRAEMLAEIMRFRYGIAIAGTHGKTTTTSMIATLLEEAGLDPTFVVGGKVNSYASSARLGSGNYLVAEADESDASFLNLQPLLSIVTNIDEDHMSTYAGDVEKLHRTFVEFLQHLPFHGLAVLCIDDPGVVSIIPKISRPVITYGFSAEADIRAKDFVQDGLTSRFVVEWSGCEPLQLELNLPGKYNVLNALAAIAVATELDIDNKTIVQGLAKFAGIGRRFQLNGEVNINGDQVHFIDDYAHHPTEMAAIMQTVREVWQDRRLVVVFQPHRYSRTNDLFDDFAAILADTDILLLMNVFSAGERPISGADSHKLLHATRLRGLSDAILVEEEDDLIKLLSGVIQAGDVVLTMGAGSISKITNNMADSIQKEKNGASSD